MMDSGKMEKNKEKLLIIIQMEINMMDNTKIIRNKVRVCITMQTELNIKEIGKMGLLKDKVYNIIKMDQFIKVLG
jgi:hypothetical protein